MKPAQYMDTQGYKSLKIENDHEKQTQGVEDETGQAN